MAEVARLRVYPVKGLDGIDVDGARVTEGGVLEHDRAYALFDADGEVINGKRTPRVHGIDASFDPDAGRLTARADGEERRFDLPGERGAAGDWLSDVLGIEAELRHDPAEGFVDRPEAGPSVISTATVETVASWYDGLSAESVRRRLRANVEVGGVPAFWEDRFAGGGAFVAGDVRLEGVEPCGRCVVPERDPDTGDRMEGFRERFVRLRRETFPEDADADAFDHHYAVMLIARVPDADRGKRLAVGDRVDVG